MWRRLSSKNRLYTCLYNDPRPLGSFNIVSLPLGKLRAIWPEPPFPQEPSGITVYEIDQLLVMRAYNKGPRGQLWRNKIFQGKYILFSFVAELNIGDWIVTIVVHLPSFVAELNAADWMLTTVVPSPCLVWWFLLFALHNYDRIGRNAPVAPRCYRGNCNSPCDAQCGDGSGRPP